MDYILHILIVISIFSVLTMSLNYIAGYTGILSISHATFYGIGAYSTAILTTQYGYTFIPSVLVGIVLTGLVAWLASFPLLRLKEDSFVLVSFGFAIIMYNIMLNWVSLTKGPLGIKGILAPQILGVSFFQKPLFLVLALVVLGATYFVLQKIVSSPYGTLMKAIRENEIVTGVNGHNVLSYQRSVFVVGALFAAVAGSLMATYLAFIEPKLFELMPSVFLLVMVIIGGMGNLKGSILGAAVLILIPEILRFVGIPNAILGETQQMIYGILLVAMMVLRPQGLLGDYKL